MKIQRCLWVLTVSGIALLILGSSVLGDEIVTKEATYQGEIKTGIPDLIDIQLVEGPILSVKLSKIREIRIGEKQDVIVTIGHQEFKGQILSSFSETIVIATDVGPMEIPTADIQVIRFARRALPRYVIGAGLSLVAERGFLLYKGQGEMPLSEDISLRALVEYGSKDSWPYKIFLTEGTVLLSFPTGGIQPYVGGGLGLYLYGSKLGYSKFFYCILGGGKLSLYEGLGIFAELRLALGPGPGLMVSAGVSRSF